MRARYATPARVPPLTIADREFHNNLAEVAKNIFANLRPHWKFEIFAETILKLKEGIFAGNKLILGLLSQLCLWPDLQHFD